MNVHVIEEMSDGARGPASVLVVVRGGRGRAGGGKICGLVRAVGAETWLLVRAGGAEGRQRRRRQ